MKSVPLLAVVAFSAATGCAAAQSIEEGRLLAKLGGCNDCHTPGYAESAGKTPESEWLTGGRYGLRGPWGTTYPANLRLLLRKMSEDEWVAFARTFETRPPMPWYDLHEAPESMLRGFHRFVLSLGDPGKPVPDYVPPDQEPKTPFIVFAPPTMPKTR
jgi:hypothetical protein